MRSALKSDGLIEVLRTLVGRINLQRQRHGPERTACSKKREKLTCDSATSSLRENEQFIAEL
jgi:hypothetical protein